MDLRGFILYTIGTNRFMERDQLEIACRKEYKTCPVETIAETIQGLIESSIVHAFGSTLSLPSLRGIEAEPSADDHPSILPKVVLAGGVLGIILALAMDVSVEAPGTGMRVNNTGLMNTRIVLSIGGVGLLLAGTMLIRKG